jgi:CMP-N-acetylneuraminic acid synthetase
MKIVAVVPIKLHNERLPGKNTRRFYDGTPLIQLMLNALLKVPELTEIYVYCSNEAIKEYLPYGIRYLQRDTLLDRSETKGNQILEKFVNAIYADIYVLSHVTAPFTKPESISKCIQGVLSGNHDSGFLAQRLPKLIWTDAGPLIFDAHDVPRTQDLPKIYAETSGAFVFTKEAFEKYKSRNGNKPFICEVSAIESIDIDYPEDFDIANAIYKEIIMKASPPPPFNIGIIWICFLQSFSKRRIAA